MQRDHSSSLTSVVSKTECQGAGSVLCHCQVVQDLSPVTQKSLCTEKIGTRMCHRLASKQASTKTDAHHTVSCPINEQTRRQMHTKV